jgi:hypothetical protein
MSIVKEANSILVGIKGNVKKIEEMLKGMQVINAKLSTSITLINASPAPRSWGLMPAQHLGHGD